MYFPTEPPTLTELPTPLKTTMLKELEAIPNHLKAWFSLK